MAGDSFKVKKSLHFNPNSEPVDPQNGDVYYDETEQRFRFYEDGIFKTLANKDIFTTVTANYTAVDGDKILADSSGGPFTITLPAEGSVDILDPTDDWFANNVTVVGVAQTIDGDPSLILDEDGSKVKLIYNGSEWRSY